MNFWRATTDNDKGWRVAKVCKAWRDASDAQKAPEGAEAKLDVFGDNGRRYVSLELDVVSTNLPPVPRVGVTFKIPKDFTKVKWYGMGPWENYCDRSRAATLGIWDATIGVLSGYKNAEGKLGVSESALNPDNYVRPGEQGYRTGCRWVEFSNAEGKKIRVTAINAPFGFNAWPYSQEALENAKHQTDLVAGDEITVNIDAAQMGISGDNSWGFRPHPERMIGVGRHELKFCVEGALRGVAKQ